VSISASPHFLPKLGREKLLGSVPHAARKSLKITIGLLNISSANLVVKTLSFVHPLVGILGLCLRSLEENVVSGETLLSCTHSAVLEAAFVKCTREAGQVTCSVDGILSCACVSVGLFTSLRGSNVAVLFAVAAGLVAVSVDLEPVFID
jgi:hypothetical protein